MTKGNTLLSAGKGSASDNETASEGHMDPVSVADVVSARGQQDDRGRGAEAVL